MDLEQLKEESGPEGGRLYDGGDGGVVECKSIFFLVSIQLDFFPFFCQL